MPHAPVIVTMGMPASVYRWNFFSHGVMEADHGRRVARRLPRMHRFGLAAA